MMKKKRIFALALTSVMLLLTVPAAWGQEEAHATVRGAITEESVTSGQVDVGCLLDRFLDRAKIAADAAGIISEADKHRREADWMLKAGRRAGARVQLRQAGELIAAAAPDRDAKHDDPFLREYLREITAALVALDSPSIVSDSSMVGSGNIGEGISESYPVNPRVALFRDYWLGRGRARLNLGRERLAAYGPMMARIFREEGVPEWLLAVGFVESTYSPAALSPKQALGIWQFIPGTGVRFGLQRTAWTDERQDPVKSTRAAARYLRNLHALFGDWPLAIAAYNTGENRVARIIERTGVRDFWTMAAQGLLAPETINYVPSVLAASQLLNASRSMQVGREKSDRLTMKTSRRMDVKIKAAETTNISIARSMN